MAIRALDVHSTVVKTFPGDTDGEPTKFTIGALDSRVFGKLKDRQISVGVDTNNPDADADVKLAQNEFAFEVAQFGLKGLDNYQDKDGNQMPFRTEKKVIGAKSYDVAHSDILTTMPGAVLSWLAQEIMAMNSLDAASGK